MSWKLSNNPRDWQKIAIQSWIDNKHRGIAKVVTGGGKTFFAMMCMLEKSRENPLLRFLIIVPTVALRDQWTLDIIDDLQVSRDEIYCHGIDNNISPNHKIVIMIINSARNKAVEITREGLWMLVVDECHRAASEENRLALEGEWDSTLGLSATPERQYDDLFELILIPKLGSLIANYDYTMAKKDGVISDFELRNYLVPMTEKEKTQMNKLTAAIARGFDKMHKDGFTELPPSLLNLLMRRSRHSQSLSYRIPIAVKVCKEFLGKKMIIFHESIKSANMINALMDIEGFRSTIYHSELTPEEKFNNLQDFRNGIKDVLVTCRALDEGLNVKDAEIGVIVASTKSTRQRIQRLGRVLRTSDDKERSVVITIYSKGEEDELFDEARKFEGLIDVKWFGGD